MRRLVVSLALMFCTTPALAAMQAKPVVWTMGKESFSGVLVYDDANATKRPGVLMVPDWKGVTPNAVAKARTIAGDDYVVLVADVYGKNVRPKNDGESRALTRMLYADRKVLRARVAKSLDVLKAQSGKAPLDPKKIGAIGYCFGGATVLELARSGADVAGVVAFHGGLATSMPAKPGAVKASVLVLNGADNQGTAGDIAGFQREMDAAGVDWQFVNFSGAAHCFALPEAKDPPGCVYNARAARRAERMMRVFFAERFAAVR